MWRLSQVSEDQIAWANCGVTERKWKEDSPERLVALLKAAGVDCERYGLGDRVLIANGKAARPREAWLLKIERG